MAPVTAPTIIFGSMTVLCPCGSVFTVGPNIATGSHHACSECGRHYVPMVQCASLPDDGEPRQSCGHDRDADCRCGA